MDSIIIALLGLLLGAGLMYWFFSLTRTKRRKELVKHQSTIILDRIKRVCKLVIIDTLSKILLLTDKTYD